MRKTVKSIISLSLCLVIIMGIFCSSEIFGSIRAEASESIYSNGDVIEYGSYPQSKIYESNTELIQELDSASQSIQYIYSKSSGGPSYEYVDFTYNGENYRKLLTTYSDGATYTEYFIFEPIRWIVLDSSCGLVMAESPLEAMPFNVSENAGQDSYKSDYSKSSLRTFLNDEFFNKAFTSTEKDNIGTTSLDNSPKWDNKSSAFESTNDKVFVLSYDEHSKYWDSDAYKHFCTDYANESGGSSNPEALRTSYDENSTYTIEVTKQWNGYKTIYSTYENHLEVGWTLSVRPAMHLLNIKNEAVGNDANSIVSFFINVWNSVLDFFSGIASKLNILLQF